MTRSCITCHCDGMIESELLSSWTCNFILASDISDSCCDCNQRRWATRSTWSWWTASRTCACRPRRGTTGAAWRRRRGGRASLSSGGGWVKPSGSASTARCQSSPTPSSSGRSRSAREATATVRSRVIPFFTSQLFYLLKTTWISVESRFHKFELIW